MMPICPPSPADRTGKGATKDKHLVEDMGREGPKNQIGVVLGHEEEVCKEGVGSSQCSGLDVFTGLRESSGILGMDWGSSRSRRQHRECGLSFQQVSA